MPVSQFPGSDAPTGALGDPALDPNAQLHTVLEELARRKDRAGDRVLLISANETVERAAQLPGVVGYVKKPFDLDEVLALVEKYLQ